MPICSDKKVYTRASIDRIDSTIGYHLSNVRFVCYWVNISKHLLTDRDLNEWCTLMHFTSKD